MALPEKEYFYLQDVGKRWSVELPDLRYYAEHGLLTLQTWLPDTIVKLYRHKRTEDGEVAPVQIGITNFKGYAVVEPDELRKVFRHDRHAVSLFRSADGPDLFKIYETRKKPTVFGTDEIEEATRFAHAQNAIEGQNVYVGASLRKPGIARDHRAGDQDILALTAYYADLDSPESAVQAKNKYRTCPPTCVVVTGRVPHIRAQLWWRQGSSSSITSMPPKGTRSILTYIPFPCAAFPIPLIRYPNLNLRRLSMIKADLAYLVFLCAGRTKTRRTRHKTAIVRMFLNIVAQRFAHRPFHWVCECAACAPPMGGRALPHTGGVHARLRGGVS